MKHFKMTTALVALSLLGCQFAITQSASAAQAATAPGSAAADQSAKIKGLVDEFYKARELKDWGRCLEIAEECKGLGEEGRDTADFIRFNVYVRSGNDDLVKKRLNEILGKFSESTSTYFEVKEKMGEKDSEKLLKSLDFMLDSLNRPAQALKLRKLQVLLAADKPAEYIKFARSLMVSDPDNHYLLNRAAWFIVCPDLDSEAEKDVAAWRIGGKKMYGDPNGSNLSGPDIPNGIPLFSYSAVLRHSAGFRTKEVLAVAKELVDKALSLSKGNTGYLDTLGWTYFRMGDKKKAAATEREAAKDGSDNYKRAAEYFEKGS